MKPSTIELANEIGKALIVLSVILFLIFIFFPLLDAGR